MLPAHWNWHSLGLCVTPWFWLLAGPLTGWTAPRTSASGGGDHQVVQE